MISRILDGFLGGEGGEKQDPRVTHRIHDQNQQNIIKTNKSQKNFGGYFWWGFSDLGRKQQNQARKHGVGLQKRDQRVS